MVVIDKVSNVVPSLLAKGLRSTSLPMNKAKWTEDPWLAKMMLSKITVITGAKPMDINFNAISGIVPCDFNYIIFPLSKGERVSCFTPVCPSVCRYVCPFIHLSVKKYISHSQQLFTAGA